jgi:hypothetical protein
MKTKLKSYIKSLKSYNEQTTPSIMHLRGEALCRYEEEILSKFGLKWNVTNSNQLRKLKSEDEIDTLIERLKLKANKDTK